MNDENVGAFPSCFAEVGVGSCDKSKTDDPVTDEVGLSDDSDCFVKIDGADDPGAATAGASLVLENREFPKIGPSAAFAAALAGLLMIESLGTEVVPGSVCFFEKSKLANGDFGGAEAVAASWPVRGFGKLKFANGDFVGADSACKSLGETAAAGFVNEKDEVASFVGSAGAGTGFVASSSGVGLDGLPKVPKLNPDGFPKLPPDVGV